MSYYNQNPIYIERQTQRQFINTMKNGTKAEKELMGKANEFEKKCYGIAFALSAGFWMLVIAGIIWATVALVQAVGIMGLIFNPITMIIGFFATISSM